MDEADICCFRTDYSDDAKWEYLKKRWDVDEIERCTPFMKLMDDRGKYEEKTIEELNEIVCEDEYIIADSRTMKDNTFAVVECSSSRVVRFDVRQLSFPVCNLPISNVTFDDYYRNMGVDGVYR